jgi:hypothetical protein
MKADYRQLNPNGILGGLGVMAVQSQCGFSRRLGGSNISLIGG